MSDAWWHAVKSSVSGKAERPLRRHGAGSCYGLGSSLAARRPACGTRHECSVKSTTEKSVRAPAWCADPRWTGTACINVATPKLTCAQVEVLGLGLGSGVGIRARSEVWGKG